MNQKEIKDLEEYLEFMIKPDLEQFAKEHNTTIEEIMLNTITIEDTKLFNYKEKQNIVYNRLHDSKIKTLKDLFQAIENNTIHYGKNNIKKNNNYFIHNEIDGIISLLKYKYLRIYPDNLKELLNYQINFNFNIYINPYSDYRYPGNLFKSINKETPKNIKENIISFYKILKSCGFNQTATKTLIDIAYKKQLTNITLGQFLSTLTQEEIKTYLRKIPEEIQPFINILRIINDFQEEYNLLNNQNKSIR